MRKPPKPWAPVPVAVQIARHKAALAAAAKAAKTPQAVKNARHAAAVRAARARAAHGKKRQWSPDEAYALCSVRAVAAAAGLDLTDAELVAAYQSAAEDPAAGLPIAAAIAVLGWPPLRMPVLGISCPQPHAVAADPSGLWWSWGELYEPWTRDVDEAWEAVTWPL